MDVEPIYCAEQIQVPADLAEVLKTFTKQVIRQQPPNIIEFSSKYFADLAAKHNALHSVTPPSRQQLRQAFLQLRATPQVALADLSIACTTAGIPADTLNRVVLAARIQTAAAVSILEVLLVMLSMSCDTLAATIQGMFDVFGSNQQLGVPDFLSLLGFLAARDSEVSSEMQAEVARALEGQTSTDYKGLMAIPALANRLLQ